jgi:hypothetical protein
VITRVVNTRFEMDCPKVVITRVANTRFLSLQIDSIFIPWQEGLYYVVTDRWQRFSDLALTPESIEELAQSADEFLVHGVDVEGMRCETQFQPLI